MQLEKEVQVARQAIALPLFSLYYASFFSSVDIQKVKKEENPNFFFLLCE